MITMVPRGVWFDAWGKAIDTRPWSDNPTAVRRIIDLPTDNYDWCGPVKVEGKTEAEIKTHAQIVYNQMIGYDLCRQAMLKAVNDADISDVQKCIINGKVRDTWEYQKAL